MPVFLVTSPDGKKYEVNGPEGSTIEQAIQYVQTNLVQSSPEVAQAQPKEGLAAAFAGGFKRLLSTGETAAESLIDPELAAKRGLERAQQLGQEYAPGASLEKVKQAYAERGFFPAVGEAISQIPTALAEQAPQIAATLGSAKAGALAGSAFGPVGSVVGGLGGATIPSLIQLYGANIERQAQEKAPEISRTAALGAAVPGAALEVASTFIPLGRNLVGKLLGPGAAQALARGSNEAIERAAQESLTASLLKGTSVGLLAEIPTEVTQQMLERLQAGLPLTTEDALKEYGEAAYGAGLVGGPFGAGARALGRPAAREQFEQLQQEEAARLAVSEEELAQRFPDVLPGGFKIEREELGKEMAPQGFSIMVEGRDEPLSVVDTQEEADAKFESLTKIRAEERENLLKEEEKINADVQKAKDKLERLEATEQTNTDEYQALKAEFPAMMDESAQKIKDLYDRSESLAKPLTVMPFGEVERVNEQFKVVGPDAKPVGTFKTLGEAEATIQQAVGEDVFKQTKQSRETAKELYKTFVPQMRKFGLGDVGLNIVDRIENGAGGAYLNKLIKVSLEDANPVQTMRHESLHAMKDLGFFTPQQWRALEERANKQWIKELKEAKYDDKQSRYDAYVDLFTKEGEQKGFAGEELDQYVNEAVVEESIADAFGAYDKGAKPPPGMIAALFRKIKNFFSSLGQALRGAGFQSADDIFQQIERGRLKPAAQPAAEAKPVAEEKLSLAPKGIPQKIWALHEKAQLADEESTGRIAAGKAPGTLKRNQTMTFRRLNKEVMDFVGGDQQKALDLMSRMNAVSGIRDAIKNQDDQALEIYRVSNPEVYAQEVGKEKLSLAKPSEWKATDKDIKQADKYFDENGVLPYTSEGQIDVPLDVSGTKYSIKKPYDQKAIAKDQTLKNDPLTGLPLNANGTVTLYFPTDNAGARDLAKTKRLKGATPEANRVYLTNESSAAAVQAKPGLIDQPLGGANVLLQVDPSLLQSLGEYEDGRKDFFIPIAEGQYFAKKMAQTKLFTLNAPRTKGLHPDRTLSQVTKMVNDAADAWAKASKKERAEMFSKAKATLREQHNIEKLFGANAKLEKTNIGEYGLTYNGKKVMSTGLGLASAQKINDEQRATTCPQSAICESLCLGETSGQNLLYGGDGQFRSGPRLSQFLKTEALVVNPEAFATVLIKQIDTFRNAAKKLGYQAAIRLNVTSDFNPKTFENIINMFPDVMFYDYTKLDTKPIAPNHHLTYSSTGASQVVNGEVVYNKESNWDRMVDKILSNGKNVAMAFTSRNDMPKAIFDERTGKTFQVWNGDEYDARFLDPVRKEGDGWIVGLTNKDNTTKPEEAAKKHNGFFLDYDAKRDGDTLIIRDQSTLKPKDDGKPAAKVIPIAKLSLKTPSSPAFKQWFGNSKIVNKDGTPMVMYHGLAKDTTDFTRKTARGAPIFLTDDPTFAAKFAADSYEQVAKHPEEYLTDKQIKDGVKRAISAIKKDYRGGKDTLGKEMIDSLSTGDIRDATFEAQEYLQKEYMKMLPAGPHIMPLYVRAERPFDYENPEHIRMVRAIAELDEEDMAELGWTPADFWKSVAQGDWTSIEANDVQNAIKEFFDSFYVKELGRKNLAVYRPNQVKSATGNLGTYSLKSPDVRYSLRGVAFPTVKEAEDAAEAVNVPDTPAFKQFMAGSQWVDEDGKAKKFYHATTGNFFEFKDGVIYLSETAQESEKWGRMAEDRLRERIYKALNKDEKLPFFQQAVDEAVSKDKITKAQGEKFMRDASRKIPDFGDYDLIKKEMDDVLLSLSPERLKIMPLYARAMAPFDFRNREQVDQVIEYIRRNQEIDRQIGDVAKEINEQIGGAPTTNVENIIDGLKGNLVKGITKAVENPYVQSAIRRLGFDGYVLRRNTNPSTPISYAVFSPRQVKSVTANEGPYSLESKDIRYSLRKFNKEDLPQKKNVYVLPADTLIYHGAYKERADQIEKTGGVLLSRPPMKVSGGLINEGGLIFFGAEDTAKAYAESRADPMAAKYAREAGIERLPGKVFETMTDRPYRLIKRTYEVNAAEAKALNKALGLPDYKSLSAGDSLKIAASRADDFRNSNIERYTVAKMTGEPLEISAPWPVILRTLNMDGFFDDFSIALTADNGIRLIGEDGKLEKFSLPTLSKAANDRIKEVAPGRIELGFKERVIGGFKKDFTWLRQAAINRYDSIAKNDKRYEEKVKKAGGPELLADQKAEFAALQSDVSAGVAASAMGIGERQGGVPVYRNGFTTIDTSVKGLTEALAPLAKYGDPEVYQRYQFWAGWKRGRRLLKEGREELYNAADAKLAQEIEAQHPEFVQVQKDLIAFNNGIVNYGVQTGVLSRERAQVYTQYADYIPFYRQLDLDKTIGPNPFSGISGVRGPKELKGGEAPLADFLETMVRNTQSMINAGMKNVAAQRATKVALEIKEVERLPRPATGIDVYTQLENGQVVYYRSSDQLFIEALKSLNMPDLPFIGLLSAPANALRNLVTKDPGFMMANLLRDSLSSYVTSGQKITPIVGTMVNFGKALSAKDKNIQALFNAGIIGGYDFSQNIQQSGEALSADLNKKASKDAILLRPFKSIWEALEKGTTASDAATRMAVYERVMKETGNEAEAISRAMEVMNFSRKGNSVLIRIATAAIPFFNARLQGLDLFYRASTGQMNTNDAKEIKRRFWVRGMTMAALSVMYYLSVADDEEYQKQEEETKDNNWIFPSLGIRIPIPFEVGVLFKTMPERITALLMGNDTGKDLSASTVRALVSTFAFNPIPQTFKPLFEVATNFNFFTMRPIVGQGMQEVEAKFQVGPGTSKTAEYIGGLLNLSPLKVDQLIKGYTGTIGGYVTDVVDSITSEFSDMPKASLRFEQLPVVKRFALDPEARGAVTQFYELQRSVDTVVRTMNLLEKTARPEEFAKYLEDNIGLLAAKDYVRDIEKEMKGLRDMRRVINSSDMDPNEKRDLLTDLGRMENNLTANIKEVKKAVSQLK